MAGLWPWQNLSGQVALIDNIAPDFHEGSWTRQFWRGLVWSKLGHKKHLPQFFITRIVGVDDV